MKSISFDNGVSPWTVIQDACVVLLNEMGGGALLGTGITLLCLCELLGETALWVTRA